MRVTLCDTYILLTGASALEESDSHVMIQYPSYGTRDRTCQFLVPDSFLNILCEGRRELPTSIGRYDEKLKSTLPERF